MRICHGQNPDWCRTLFSIRTVFLPGWQLLWWSSVWPANRVRCMVFVMMPLLSGTYVLLIKVNQCRFLVSDNTQKILMEIWHHFWLKMMMKSSLEKIILKFLGGLQRYLLTCQANSALLGRFFCTGQKQLWRGLVNFKKKVLDHFLSLFLSINVNFKTRDFSPFMK